MRDVNEKLMRDLNKKFLDSFKDFENSFNRLNSADSIGVSFKDFLLGSSIWDSLSVRVKPELYNLWRKASVPRR